MKTTVELPPSLRGSGAIGKVESSNGSILLNGGVEVRKALQLAVMENAKTRHGTANRLGARKTGHWDAMQVRPPVVEGDAVSVEVNIRGANRAYHDIVINPVEAKALAIPLHRDAYGVQPREYSLMHRGTKKALFRPKGTDILARAGRKKGTLEPLYALKKRVVQKRDPSLLPQEDELMKAFTRGVEDAIGAILEKD